MPRQSNLPRTLVGGCCLIICGCALPPAGTMEQQQASAVIHDPFPQDDIGPYEAAARPPNYQRPLPLPVRNRIAPDAFRMTR